VQWTVGGHQIHYPGDVSTKTADLTTAKIMFNSVLSDPSAKFMTGDIKDFYLNTPMERYEYIQVPVSAVPDVIIDEYNLAPLVVNGHLYAEVHKGMYGLPQAGQLANDRLTTFLAPFGYAPVPITPGLWRNKTRNIAFTLVVDDFGVKYLDRRDAEATPHGDFGTTVHN